MAKIQRMLLKNSSFKEEKHIICEFIIKQEIINNVHFIYNLSWLEHSKF